MQFLFPCLSMLSTLQLKTASRKRFPKRQKIKQLTAPTNKNQTILPHDSLILAKPKSLSSRLLEYRLSIYPQFFGRD